MSEIMPFNFEGQNVRVIVDLDGEPWWVAADVCAVLGLANVTEALSRLDRADISTTEVRSGGQNRQMKIVNESGLWDLVLDSRKSEARRLRKWVTSEVLPALRKTGSYTLVPQSFAEALELAAAQARELEAASAHIAELEPAAEQFHKWQVSEDAVHVVEWAKTIHLTQKEAFEALREMGVLFKQQHEGAAFNVPKRGFEKYFDLVDEYLPAARRWVKVPLIKPEGQVVLAEMLIEHGWISG